MSPVSTRTVSGCIHLMGELPAGFAARVTRLADEPRPAKLLDAGRVDPSSGRLSSPRGIQACWASACTRSPPSMAKVCNQRDQSGAGELPPGQG